MPSTESQRITTLEHAVFGITGENGLLAEVAQLRGTLNKLYFSIVAAAISFAAGSVSVVVAIVATN